MSKGHLITIAGMHFVIRWAMAPFCFGLFGVLLILLLEFFRELVEAVLGFGRMSNDDAVFIVLKLIALALVGNLVSIMIDAGLRPLGSAATTDDPDHRLTLMDGLAFKAVLLRVLAVMIAILTVGLLEDFITSGAVDTAHILWRILILLAIVVVSGLGLVGMYRLAEGVQK
jgi:uncharacterized protein (TIGR00645 family)